MTPPRASRSAMLVAGAVAVVATGLLALPTPTLADVVVHDGGVHRDRTARETVKARTGKAPHLILSADVLAGPSRLLAANTSLERCEGPPVKFDFRRKLDEITNLVLAFSLEEARSALAIVDTLLPCSSTPVPRRELARFAFLEGATLLDLGDEDGAVAAMTRAATFDPKYGGERGFPGPHVDLLTQQRGLVSSLSPGRLFVWREPGMRELFVNGVEIERVRDRGVGLKPGTHLLQVVSSTGLQGMWVETRGSQSTLVFPSSGRSVWADGGRSPGGESAMRLLLNDEFQGREGDVHTIHYQGRRGFGATYPWDGGERVAWSEPQKDKAPTTTRKPESKPPSSGEESADATDGPSGSETAKTEATSDGPSRGGQGDEAPEDGVTEEDTSLELDPDEASGPTTVPEAPEEDSGSPPPADGTADSEDTTASAPDREPPSRTAHPRDKDKEASEDNGTQAAGEADATEPTDEASAAPTGKTKAGRTKNPRLRAVVAVGYQYAEPFHYLMGGIDLSLRLKGILEVTAFVRPSYGGVHEFPVEEGANPIVGPVFFVPFGASLGVRKAGTLSPWVSAGVQMAYNRDGLSAAPYLFGALLHGGLDWSPKNSRFLIRVQGEVGNMGLHFNTRFSGGAGIRF